MLRLTNSWSESTDSPECSICYDEYEPSFDNVTILMNCYHKFHTNPCLKTYIKKKQIALKQAREPTDKIECPFCKIIMKQNRWYANEKKKIRKGNNK
jgi:hypothetical protein